MKRTFIFSDDKSNKFWTIEVNGNSFTVVYGRMGTAGQTQIKEFDNEAACLKAADKLIAEKTKKGYTEGNPAEVVADTPATPKTAKPSKTKKEVKPPESGVTIQEVIDSFKAFIDEADKEIRKIRENDKDKADKGVWCTTVKVWRSNNYFEYIPLFDGNFYRRSAKKGDKDVEFKKEYSTSNYEITEQDWDTLVVPELTSYFRQIVERSPEFYFPKVQLELSFHFSAHETLTTIIDEPRYSQWFKTVSGQLNDSFSSFFSTLLQFIEDSNKKMLDNVSLIVERLENHDWVSFRTWCDSVHINRICNSNKKNNVLTFSPQFNNNSYHNRICRDENIDFTSTLELGESTVMLSAQQWDNEVIPAIVSYFRTQMEQHPDNYFPSLNLEVSLDMPVDEFIPDYSFFNHKTKIQVVNQERYDIWHNEMLHLIKTGYEDFRNRDMFCVVTYEAGYIVSLMPEVGYDAVAKCINILLDNVKVWYRSCRVEVVEGLTHYLRKMSVCFDGPPIHTVVDWPREELILVPPEYHDRMCFCALMLILHGDVSDEDTGIQCIRYLSMSNSQRAKDIAKFGTGMVPKEFTEYKDKNVTITANDIKSIVNIKVTNECDEAYAKSAEFLATLLRKGFPMHYDIKFSSKVHKPAKNEDAMPFFWNTCAKHPKAHYAIRDYINAGIDKGEFTTFYDDSLDERAMPIGGYAVYALAYELPNSENHDIIIHFMSLNDSDHIYAMDELAEIVIERVGITPETVDLVEACIGGGSIDNEELFEKYKKQLRDVRK